MEEDHGGSMGEESWGRIAEEDLWRMHHAGVIVEEAARRRQLGGGSQKEAAGRHQDCLQGVKMCMGNSMISVRTVERRHSCAANCI